MKTAEIDSVSLANYGRGARSAPLVLTRRGKPVAAVVPIRPGMDLESYGLSPSVLSQTFAGIRPPPHPGSLRLLVGCIFPICAAPRALRSGRLGALGAQQLPGHDTRAGFIELVNRSWADYKANGGVTLESLRESAAPRTRRSRSRPR